MYVFKWLHKMPLTQNSTKNALNTPCWRAEGNTLYKEHDRQYVYNVTLRRFSATIVVVEKQ
jgi:hypothetical protein